MPFLTYNENGNKVAVRLREDVTTIGRAADCTIQIDNDTEVSRFHCSIQRYADDTFRVMDTASKNGTFVNGEGVWNDEIKLTPGDIIRVGMTKFRFTLEENGGTEPSNGVSPAPGEKPS